MMKVVHQKTLKGLFALVFFLTATISWGQYSTGFEGNYKGSYTTGDATIDGAVWTMDDALVGNLSSDAKAGSWSVRIRNTGSIEMKTDIAGGIGVFSLKYGKYSSDGNTSAFNVEYSTNGGTNWTQMGSTVSSVSNTALQTFTATLNISGSVRVRVVKTAGGSNRLNIDDVTWIAGASSASTIVRNASFTEPADINYSAYQATDVTTANSIQVGSFDIRDGGSGLNDADANATTLNNISFTVSNFSQLRRLAIYDGTTEKGEVAVSSGTVSFTGVSLTAADGGTKNFTLRATFAGTVTDNAQVSFTVSSATVASGSSGFAATNAGGAATSATGNSNRIEVTADRLAFITQPANTNANAAMSSVTVSANDALGNRDLDFTSGVKVTSTGTLSGSPVSATSVTSGLATFTSLTHTQAGTGLVLTAQRTATSDWNANSNTFTINKLNQSISNFSSNISKTYGDANFTLGATASSGLTVTYTSSDTSVATVTGNTVTILKNGTTTITATQPGDGVYNAAASIQRTLTVNKKQLAVTGAVAQSKMYDGTTDAVITGATLSGSIVGSDDVALDSFYVAAFNNKNVGTAKPVDAAFQLTGAQADRYTLNDPTGLTADITAKELGITGISIADKDYDSTTSAVITGIPVLTGVIGSEDVSLVTSGATAAFNNIGPGEDIPVTVSGYTLAGTDKANYIITRPTGLAADIFETGLQNQTITFNELAAVTYGDADFVLNATASSGLTVTYTSSDESVATVSGNTVTITGAGTTVITAYQEGNSSYNPAVAVEQDLLVNKKTITVADAAVVDKIYNGNDIAELTGTLTGVVGDDIVVLDGTGQFATVDVANGIAVETLYGISGADAGNYILTQPGSLTGNIVPAQLTLNGAAATSKQYDGTDAAAVTGTLSGIVPGDAVSYNGTGTFVSANVGTDIPVTSTATLTGADTGNYILIQPTGLTANITAKALTVTATAEDKQYDGTTSAGITVTAINGIVEGDQVAVAGGGTFATAAVGTNKPVTAALALTGSDAGNYTLTQPVGLTADITPMALVVDVTDAQVADKVYDRTTANAVITGVVISGVAPGEDVQVVSGTFASSQAGFLNNTVTPVLSGAHAGNYTFTQTGTLTGTIVPKEATITGLTAASKTYDGTNAATLSGGSLQGVYAADVVAGVTLTRSGYFAPVSETDQGEDVGTGKTVISTSALTGTGATNYTFTQPTGPTANITPKALTITGVTANGKVYDRTNAATITAEGASLTGLVNNDNVVLGGTPSAAFTNVNAGTRTVAVTGFTLSGSDAGNYTVTQPAGLTAGIAPKPITMTGGSVTTKTYNASAAATVTGVTLVGVEVGDTVTATTGTFASANAGTHNVTVLLSGASAGNYTLTQPDPMLTGTINKATLTATAQNKSKTVNTANPTLTLSYSGFAGSDNAADDADFTPPTLTTTAVTNSPAGAYPITFATPGDALNYNITYVTGYLIVNAAETTAFSGTLWSNPISGGDESQSPYTEGQTVAVSSVAPVGAAILTVTGILRGPGIQFNAGSDRYNAKSFDTPSLDPDGYFSFGLAPIDGYKLNLTQFNYSGEKSSSFTSPQFALRSSLDNFTANIGSPGVSGPVSLSAAAYQNLTGAIEFRLYVWGAGSSGNTYSINDFSFTGSVNQAAPAPEAPTVTSSATDSSTVGLTDTYQITASGTPVIDTFNASGTNASGSTTTALQQGISVNTSTGLVSFDGTTPVGTYYIKVSASSYYGTGTKVLTYTVVAAPSLTAIPNPIASFHAYQGQGASAPVQLSAITGTNLAPASGTITLTVTGNFEVALGVAAYSASGSFSYTGGTINLNNPQIYVRMKSGLAIGDYNGTLTLSGGGTTYDIALSGQVEESPSVTTAAMSYGPYCIGTQNNIDLAYTTTGSFPAGNYYVQLSDAFGVFPTDFTNIISGPASASPIAATLPNTMAAGNYRVRVLHLSSAPTLTFSLNNNGSDIVIKALPTLTGIQLATGCANSNAAVTLSGLLPDTEVVVSYAIGSEADTVTLTADAEGNGSFEIVLDAAYNNEAITVTSFTRTDVNPACAAAFTASATIVIDANKWTGAAGTTDWNDAGNWSCGSVPTEAIEAVIPAGDNQPELSGTNVSVASLLIEEGASMIVHSGSNLTVVNEVTVADSGILIIENNANLIQVNDVNNTGIVSIDKESAPIFRLDYALWSSPVAGETLKGFSPMTVDGRFYQYNPANDAYASVPGTTEFAEGIGYLIRVDNTHPAYDATTNYEGTPWDGTYIGTPNNGNVTVDAAAGYNAVGNPYPSPINIAAFYSANQNNLGADAALYFWRKKNGSDYSSYASLTLEGYTANGQVMETPDGGEINYGDASNGVFDNELQSNQWVLNPGQGFIVQSNGNDIVFNNTMRRAVNNGQIFDVPDTNGVARLWLNISDATGSFHQAMVSYSSNGTLGIDFGRDGKAFTDGSIAIYSIAADTQLGIQARPSFDDSDVVPMGYKTSAAGTYTISLHNVEGLFAQDQDIFLRDNLLGTVHDLKAGDYLFATEAGTFAGRFDVIYAQPLGTEHPAIDPNKVIVYKQGTDIHINSGLYEMSGVTIYDTRGRMLFSKNGINATETVINNLHSDQQVLIINIDTTEGKVTKRIIF